MHLELQKAFSKVHRTTVPFIEVCSFRVSIISSPIALPALKCECETLSTLSSYIFFSPRSIKGGVNW